MRIASGAFPMKETWFDQVQIRNIRWAYQSALVLVVLLFAFPPPACAYIDAGTEAYCVQLILGGILGLVYAFRSRLASMARRIEKAIRSCKDDKTGHE
jgi:hypothetical protein